MRAARRPSVLSSRSRLFALSFFGGGPRPGPFPARCIIHRGSDAVQSGMCFFYYGHGHTRTRVPPRRRAEPLRPSLWLHSPTHVMLRKTNRKPPAGAPWWLASIPRLTDLSACRSCLRECGSSRGASVGARRSPCRRRSARRHPRRRPRRDRASCARGCSTAAVASSCLRPTSCRTTNQSPPAKVCGGARDETSWQTDGRWRAMLTRGGMPTG